MAELDTPEPLAPLDPLTPIGRVRGVLDGTPVGDADDARSLRTLGALLGAATLVGIADAALATAQAYALERHQFGVPIGSFQAIKHLLADMYVRNAVAQSATYAAAAVLQDAGNSAAGPSVAASKALAGSAAIDGASTAVQVLGGMGFTWDMLPNYLLKRAWVLEHAFGDADHHAHDLGTTLIAAGR
jgi:alkylation response protein AidB-like acyl-CoA dehydrogenase